jgi:hypothetical protein
VYNRQLSLLNNGESQCSETVKRRYPKYWRAAYTDFFVMREDTLV